MVKIGISGAGGRMGRRIAALAAGDDGVELCAAIERAGSADLGVDIGTLIDAGELGVNISSDLEDAANAIECLIDFTLPEPTLEHVNICKEKGVAIVIGTTGFSAEGEMVIEDAAKVIPVVFAPNMAIGVNLLFDIVKKAATVLGQDFDIKIDETHHIHKKDSPSGTAKMIKKVIDEAAKIDSPVKSFREGEVIGNHGIIFDGKYERLEIRHDAKSRDAFAAGAIEAAKFIKGRSPGLYSMADVLGLK